MDAQSPLDLLERVIPFQFLSRARREALVERLERRRYANGDILVRAGERSRDVFLLAEGNVECIDDRQPPIVLSTIEAGHYFGERAALFDMQRRVNIRARGNVVAYTLLRQEKCAARDSKTNCLFVSRVTTMRRKT